MNLKRFPLFFTEDTGGGGGGAAVADAPAPDAAEAIAELSSFEPPNLDILKGDTQPEQPKKPEKTDPKKSDTKPDAKADDKKPDTKAQDKKLDPKPVDPPAKQLREELERTKAERDELRAKVESHPKVKELESTIAEREKELQTLKTEIETTRRELEIRDPLASRKLIEHEQAFDEEYRRGLEVVPELHDRFQSLVQEFAALPRNDRQAYAEKLEEFEQKLEDLVGQRKFGAALDMVRKGYEFVGKHNQMKNDLRTNAGRMAFEARESEWRKNDGEVSAILAKALEVPEDIETSDPFAPLLYISKALPQVDEAKRTQLTKTIDTFVRRVFAGQKPRSDKEFPGLSPDEIREKIEADAKWHAEARPMAVKVMKEGMLAMSLMRPLIAEVSRLRERITKLGQETPPDPTNPNKSEVTDDDDLANYRPPEIKL